MPASGPPLTCCVSNSGPSLTCCVSNSGPPLTCCVSNSGPPLTCYVSNSGPPLTCCVSNSGPPLTCCASNSGPPLTPGTRFVAITHMHYFVTGLSIQTHMLIHAKQKRLRGSFPIYDTECSHLSIMVAWLGGIGVNTSSPSLRYNNLCLSCQNVYIITIYMTNIKYFSYIVTVILLKA